MKGIKCDYCDRVFTRKSSLKRHVRNIHEDNEEQKIKCEFCDKSFSPAYLKVHISCVHEEAKKGTCHLCGNEYKQLKQHIAYFHQKPYQCENCDKRFSQKNLLRDHNNTVHKG